MDREAWNQRYADAELVWSAEANGFLVQEVADLPPGRALDLGAGEGRNAIWLGERGWRVTAVDFSGVGLQKARRLAEARGVEVNWIEANLPKGARLGYDPWLHTQSAVEALRAAAEKAGGRLVACDTNPIDAVWHDQPDAPAARPSTQAPGEPRRD